MTGYTRLEKQVKDLDDANLREEWAKTKAEISELTQVEGDPSVFMERYASILKREMERRNLCLE